ncbi:hypothetical protein [Streptomyces rapamycinicus]|uniref:Membrane protein n=2 Tax=Streptomyces rapamycinicus TaxID=1226757 RepID=A0A0A0NNM0_STRRN|nr:hypothetical protein [Streptomyces rapamycinicus]AGP58549.1 membrane protein [Streptomyces rapamycinicus NRRL 5491]MBB4786259.1 hypothetical protein [Streptomyces rapamycinicus]RLV78280.1 membrane protein [Streptomyces rapamycinicus NRRL 5491]UTO66363.1 hypothetical protein LJB45_31230 [Streptomyces rapamycinicus]UTP34317.1 hypothetical protein LIV37_36360 [Streptomyces rapamycinicus NRRL 5491]
MAERDSNENEADARRDDDAAFAAIVAAYGEEPQDPPGAERWPAAENLDEERDRDRRSAADGDTDTDADGSGDGEAATGGLAKPDKTEKPGGFIVYAPGVGPRDWEPEEPSEDDFDETDEGHFVPPEPPPLPESDTTSRFAWLGVLGGPLLLLGVVLFQVEMVWWIATLGVGGFLGGFVTLVLRMKDDGEEEDDDPGRGAVV